MEIVDKRDENEFELAEVESGMVFEFKDGDPVGGLLMKTDETRDDELLCIRLCDGELWHYPHDSQVKLVNAKLVVS